MTTRVDSRVASENPDSDDGPRSPVAWRQHPRFRRAVRVSIAGNMDHPDQPRREPNRPGAHHASRPAPRSAAASGESADRLTILAHELGNILDGSLRSLGLAERALHEAEQPRPRETPDEARKRLDVVRQSLHRMAELVDAAMRASGNGGVHLAIPASPVELGEAIFHAVDVLGPAATEHGVKINTIVSNGLSGVPAGTLYPVIVNGLTNAIEAVAAGASHGGPGGGLVEISAGWTEDGRVRVTIRDDGVGLPNAATETIFRFGFTTKSRGSGIGLAVARSIVEELPDGMLRLFSRADRPQGGRPGAVFEVTFRPCARSNGSAGAA